MRAFALGALVATAVPLFAAEIPLSPPLLVPATRVDSPAVATDGNDFLVVWADGGDVTSRIRYAKVLRNGGVADSGAKLLVQADGRNGQIGADVAFTGGHYLVTGRYPNGSALLDRDGKVLRNLRFFGSGVIAANGRFVITSAGTAAATIVSAEGDAVTTFVFPFPIEAICASAGGLAVISEGTTSDCSKAGCTNRHTLARLLMDGRVVAQSTIETFTAEHPHYLGAYSMASGSDGGLMINYAEYSDLQLDDVHRIRTIVTDFALREVDVRLSFPKDFLPYHDGMTTTAWDGDHYFVAMNTRNGLAAIRIGRDRAPVTFGPNPALFGAVVPDRLGYFLLLGDDNGGPWATSFRSDLTTSSSQGSTIPVVPDQGLPSIATDGRSVLATSQRYPGDVILLTGAGSRTISTDQDLPQVDFDGTDYLIYNGFSLAGVRSPGSGSARFLSADGALTKSIPLERGGRAIWNGSLFFLFEERADNFHLLALRRVKRSGETIDRDPILIDTTSYFALGSMATNGRDVFLVAANTMVLSRITPEGTVAWGESLPFANARLAAAGDVVYAAGTRRTGETMQLFVGAWTADLHLRWPALIPLSSGSTADNYAVAADGDSAIVVWQEAQRIAGARITRDGTVIPFAVGDVADRIGYLCVAARGGTIAIAYIRGAREEPYRGAERVFVQWLQAPPRRPATGR
jgi:hypothetical protein